MPLGSDQTFTTIQMKFVDLTVQIGKLSLDYSKRLLRRELRKRRRQTLILHALKQCSTRRMRYITASVKQPEIFYGFIKLHGGILLKHLLVLAIMFEGALISFQRVFKGSRSRIVWNFLKICHLCLIFPRKRINSSKKHCSLFFSCFT